MKARKPAVTRLPKFKARENDRESQPVMEGSAVKPKHIYVLTMFPQKTNPEGAVSALRSSVLPAV